MARKKSRSGLYLELSSPFLGLPNETIKSNELNCLSVHSRWLYVVLLTKFNREKDKVKKPFVFTYEEIREITGFDDRRISVCTKELESSGFMFIEHGGKNNPSRYRPELKWLH